MARLYVLSGPDLGRSFQIRPGDTLGRNPECIVTLRDASISREHAHIEESGEKWFLVDDRSRNGISSGGVRQTRVLLEDGCELKVGEVALRFRQDEPHTAPANEGARSPTASANLDVTVARKAPPVLPAAAPAARPGPPDVEEEIEIDSEPEIEIGVGGGATPRAQPVSPAQPMPTAQSRSPAQPVPSARTSPPAGPRAAPRELAGAGSTRPAAAGPAVRQVGGGVLQYHKVEARGSGLLGAELSQLPWWLRASLVLLALAVAVGVFAVAFRGSHLWGASQRDPGAQSFDSESLDQPSSD